MDLQPGEEIVFEGRPVWRSTLGFYVKGFLGALVIAIVVVLAGASAALAVAVWLVLFALVVLVGFVRRLATRYTITNQRLRIQRGILSRSVQQTRIERVQNVNTRQSVVERVLQVGTVDFDTAGTDDSDFTFVGVGSPHSVVEAVDRAQREAHRAHREGIAAAPPSDGL
ncbi:MAG TPA: PH domain-containing protein [Solirubrobacteraceae bacterium]